MISKLQTLKKHQGFRKYFKNTSWLMADKLLRMGVGFFVSVLIIRYLGPEQYGAWNYAIALAFLFQILSTLGLDGIVVKELVKHPKIKNKILGSAFRLKLIGGLGAVVLASTGAYILRPNEIQIVWLTAIAASGFIFQSLNVVDFYFQAQVKSRYTVISAMTAFSIVTLVKIILLITQAPLIAFAWAALAEISLTSLFFLIAYGKNHLSVRDWNYSHAVAMSLLKQSYPLILSGLAVMLYMRMDQIMIGEMIGDREVGYYTAALRISEIWYFVPMLIVSSLFPAIVISKQKNESLYLSRIQKLYDLITWIGIFMAIAVTFLSNIIINVLFGEAFATSAIVLSIHIWAGIAVSMSFVHSKWLIAEGLQKYSLLYTGTAAAVNIVGNLMLIPTYGIIGAAIATLIAQVIPIFIQYFLVKARMNFYMMFKTFLLPLRILQ